METFYALLALCAGNSLVTGEFPSQRPVMQSFDVFFHLCLNKRLSKQSLGWWFETPSNEPASQPVSQSVNNFEFQWLSQSVSWWVSQSVTLSISQSVSHQTSQFSELFGLFPTHQTILSIFFLKCSANTPGHGSRHRVRIIMHLYWSCRRLVVTCAHCLNSVEILY